MTAQLPRAVFIGDSQAEGLAPHIRVALATAGLFDVQAVIVQRGVSTRGLLDAGKIQAAADGRPDVVIFALGGNDGASPDYVGVLRRAVQVASSTGAHVVWIGPAHSIDAATERRHAAVREVQRAALPVFGVLWLDSQPWTQTGFGDDGVHFTRDAYRFQADQIAQALLRARGWPAWKIALAAGGAIAAALGLAWLVAPSR